MLCHYCPARNISKGTLASVHLTNANSMPELTHQSNRQNGSSLAIKAHEVCFALQEL